MLRQSSTCVVVLVLLLAGATQAAQDITRPGDTVIGVPNDGDWPPNESPPLAIDDIVYAKYLHSKGDFSPNVGPAGLSVTPSVGATVVTGLTFTTANEHPGRYPTAFELYGSNAGLDHMVMISGIADLRNTEDVDGFLFCHDGGTKIAYAL